MAKLLLPIILYPITEELTEKQSNLIIDLLREEDNKLTVEEIVQLFDNPISMADLKKSVDEMDNKSKLKHFQLAKAVCELLDNAQDSLKLLSKLGKTLKIKSSDTGFDFDLYKTEDLTQFEFQKTVRRFSMVSAAIGFIPFIPITDYAILSTIQIGLLSKISIMYNFKLDPKKFIKMISGTLGAGLILKFTSKVLYTLIPVVGWVINGAIAFAGTYAIGILAKRYIEEDGNLNKDSIKAIWEKSFAEGKKEFFNLKDYVLNKKDELLKEIDKYKEKAGK